MAKRQNDRSSLILIAFIVLAILILAAAYATPFVLLFGLLYYGIRNSEAYDASLSEKERNELSELEREIVTTRERLLEIEKAGAHLKINLDGSYHRGNRLGVTLNASLEELLPREKWLNHRMHEIKKRPLETLDEWTRVNSLRLAFRVTTPVYLIAGLLFRFALPELSNSTGGIVFLRLFHANDVLYGAALLSAIIAVVLLPLSYKLARGHLEESCRGMRESLQHFAAGAGAGAGADADADDDDDDDDDEEEEEEGSEEYQQEYGEEFETDERAYDQFVREEANAWYEILGVSPNASAEEINFAWRERIKRNHPDRVANLDAEFRILAEQRAKQLNAARAEGLNQAVNRRT